MLNDLNIVLTVAAALGCGIVTGVFFAFSSFVMASLARLPAGQGIAAMQSINVTVLNRGFLSLFVGTGIVGIVAAAIALTDPGEPEAILRIAGAALYLIGTLVVTGARNVPRNDALVKLAPEDQESAAPWAAYVREWTTWNTVRTIAAAAAATAYMVGLTLD